MSILDTISGLFTGETFFPDNPKREQRAAELRNDCNALYFQCEELKKQLDQELGVLSTRNGEEETHFFRDALKFMTDLGAGPAWGALYGAVERSQLREEIHRLAPIRLGLQRDVLTGSRMLQALQALNASLPMLTALGYDPETTAAKKRQMEEECVKHVQAVTDQEAQDVLTALDQSRGSWTEEDFTS